MPIVYDCEDVFPKDFLGIPLDHEIEFGLKYY